MTGEKLLAQSRDSERTNDDSAALRDHGLQLAFAHDPSLKHYAHGMEDSSKGVNELLIGQAGMLASMLLFGSPKISAMVAGASMLAATKGAWDMDRGSKESTRARPALSKDSYADLIASGDEVQKGTDWISKSMGATGVLAIGAFVVPRLLGKPVPYLAVAGILAGMVASDLYGGSKARSGVDTFDESLKTIADNALADENRPQVSLGAAVRTPAPDRNQASDSGRLDRPAAAAPSQGADGWPKLGLIPGHGILNPLLQAALRDSTPSVTNAVLRSPDVRHIQPAPSAPEQPQSAVQRFFAQKNLQTLGGDKFDISSLLAKGPVVLDFGASWCGPCQQSLPIMEQVKKDYQKKGVSFVFVDEQDDPNQLKAFLQKKGLNVNVAVDKDESLLRPLNIKGFPQTIIIAKDGTVHRLDPGAQKIKDRVSKELDAIIAGKKPQQSLLA